MTWTTDDVIRRLDRPNVPQLQAPDYDSPYSWGERVALAVPSMAKHMTDEGYQLFQGLSHAGYGLAGYKLLLPYTNVPDLLRLFHTPLSTLVLQDKREWEGKTAGPGFDRRETFHNVDCLASHPEIFKLTVLKDAQHNPEYHAESAREIACHTWVIYYHPKVVAHLCPYVRPRHLVRTYHTLDRNLVPPYRGGGRLGCLLSGALSPAYPLRQRLVWELNRLPDTTYLPHPGYGRDKCYTPEFLQILSMYRVAICTASRYGYALRKIIEATACGCRVITDLPTDEVLPEIDGNLVRVHPETTTFALRQILQQAMDTYDPDAQESYAAKAQMVFDYKVEGVRLAREIERMRQEYKS